MSISCFLIRTPICQSSHLSGSDALAMWLKIVTENYCRQIYARKIEIDTEKQIAAVIENCRMTYFYFQTPTLLTWRMLTKYWI